MKKEGLFNYSQLLSQVKKRVALAQQRAIYAANEEMLHMYWDIGEMLEKSQMADGWGKKTLERLSVDLKNDYPKVKGFSVRNLYCMMQFYEEYNKELTLPKTSHSSIVQSPTAKLDSYTNNGNYSIVQSPIAKLDKYANEDKILYDKVVSNARTENKQIHVSNMKKLMDIGEQNKLKLLKIPKEKIIIKYKKSAPPYYLMKKEKKVKVDPASVEQLENEELLTYE
jgi:hypothetical protein